MLFFYNFLSVYVDGYYLIYIIYLENDGDKTMDFFYNRK